MRPVFFVGFVAFCLIAAAGCDSGHRDLPTETEAEEFLDGLIESAHTQGMPSVCDTFASSHTMCQRQLQDNHLADISDLQTSLRCTYVLEDPDNADEVSLRVAVLENELDSGEPYFTQIGIFRAPEGLRTLEAPYWIPQGNLDPVQLCATS